MISIHLVNMFFLICTHFATKEGQINIFHRTKLILSQFLNDGFPLCLSFTVAPFIFSSPPFISSLPLKATDHHSPQSATVITAMFDIMCQNRLHCLTSASDIFFLFFIPLLLSCVVSGWFRCAKFLHECPEAFSSYEWQMQTALVRGVAHLSTDFPVVSSYEPQIGRLCFENHSRFCDVILPIVP